MPHKAKGTQNPAPQAMTQHRSVAPYALGKEFRAARLVRAPGKWPFRPRWLAERKL
jgi:hypothetical protein